MSEEAEPVSEEAEPRRKRQQAIRADVCMHNGDRVHKGIDTYRHNNNLIDTLYSRAASPLMSSTLENIMTHGFTNKFCHLAANACLHDSEQ